MVLKDAYLSKFRAETKIKKLHHDELEHCDHNLTRIPKSTLKVKKATIRRTYIKKDTFDWGPKQVISF